MGSLFGNNHIKLFERQQCPTISLPYVRSTHSPDHPDTHRAQVGLPILRLHLYEIAIQFS